MLMLCSVHAIAKVLKSALKLDDNKVAFDGHLTGQRMFQYFEDILLQLSGLRCCEHIIIVAVT
jgi:hypothetical protein